MSNTWDSSGSSTVSEASDSNKPEWLSAIYQQESLEEKYIESARVTVNLLPMEGRIKLWNMSSELIGDTRANSGVTGEACQIFERYCAGIAKKYNGPSVEFEAEISSVNQKIALFLSMCLRLATKMESECTYISGKALIKFLKKREKKYTMLEINAVEWEIYKTIECWVPTLTRVEKVGIFIEKLCQRQVTVQTACAIMDVVDLQFPLIYNQIKAEANNHPSPADSPSESGSSRRSSNDKTHVRSTHLIAAVVLATLQLEEEWHEDAAPLLARWSRGPESYVRWLATIITQHITELITIKFKKRQRNYKKPITKRIRSL